MKQLIRLTEDDLHKIIKESVNNILTELDWKTYANAAQKASKKSEEPFKINGEINRDKWLETEKNRRRSNNFNQQAINQFNKDYGYQENEFGDYDYQSVGLDGHRGHDYHVVGKKSVAPMRFYRHGKQNTSPLGGGDEIEPNNFFTKTDSVNKYKDAEKEVDAFNNDNYEYIKGQGWKKSITSESINKIIDKTINEAFSDIYQLHNFSDPNKDYYNSYVIIDGTGAVVGNYDNSNDAIADAKEMALKNKYGTYEVYGCDENYTYSCDEEDSTLIYSTDEDFA